MVSPSRLNLRYHLDFYPLILKTKVVQMKISISLNSLSKMFVALALLLIASFSFHASAADIPEHSAEAPCGSLVQVGSKKFIFNNTSVFFNVIFETKAHQLGLVRRVNAGAVKYLDYDGNNQGVWRDTGRGDYRSVKRYTIPVGDNDVVPIAYCADSSNETPFMLGSVYLETSGNESGLYAALGGAEFKSLQVTAAFGAGASTQSAEWDILFLNKSLSTLVSYNRKFSGNYQGGSLIIAPELLPDDER